MRKLITIAAAVTIGVGAGVLICPDGNVETS